MYLKYYSLEEAPFGVTPDPAFLYMSPSHKEAMAALCYGVESRKGFITVTGEVGCGKTVVLRDFLAKVDAERVRVVYLFNPELTFAELLAAIFDELGLERPPSNTASAIRALQTYLIGAFREGRLVALIIDEAHRMPKETLESLRMLSNLETSKEKLLQIILCGQPELDTVLCDHSLRQLRQRIAVRATIQPLSRQESVRYIQHRIGKVGFGVIPLFSSGALRKIVRHAGGNPRTINILCDNTLIAGYAANQKPVRAATVGDVIAGMAVKKFRVSPRWILACAAALLMMIGVSTVQFMNWEAAPTQAAFAATGQTSSDQPPALVTPASSLPVPLPTENFLAGEAVSLKLSFQMDDAVSVAPNATVTAVPAPLSDVAAPKPVTPAPRPAAALGVAAREKYIVKPGDSLDKLLTQIYGHSDQTLIEHTLQCNPQISDANKIVAGDALVFPELPSSTDNKDRRQPDLGP